MKKTFCEAIHCSLKAHFCLRKIHEELECVGRGKPHAIGWECFYLDKTGKINANKMSGHKTKDHRSEIQILAAMVKCKLK